jgi:NADPH:quinone reductase-like Zn-dependent oxidoreductase
MRAAVIRRFGPPEVVHVQEIPTPKPKPRELLIAVHASTVSVADHRLRARDIPRGLGLLVTPVVGAWRPRRRVLGTDVAGVVAAVGRNVTTFAPGDEVIAGTKRMGGHAQYAAVPAADVVRKPANLSFEDSAALIFGGHTALAYLGRVTLGPQSAVLVNGASGAVGTAVVQLAARAGARVTGVCSGVNAELVRSLGAAEVIDYTREDFAARDSRYDVIVECVGNAPFSRVAHLIKPGGALLQVIIDLRSMLAGPRQTRRTGILVTSREAKASLADLVAFAEAGELRPVVDRTHDLDDIVEAHRYVDTGRKRGNVVVRIPHP